MKERVAFVTGGGGGIGGAICRYLTQSAFVVAVADLSLEAARKATSDTGLAVEVDVTDPRSVDAAMKSVTAALGPVDVLVNCAGWDVLQRFVDTDEEFQAKVIAINLAGPMRTTRAMLPGMIERRYGRVINVASDAGRVGSSLEAIYSGAKGGLIAFSKAIAREVAKHGVTANTVCPGPTDTPLLWSATGEGADAKRVLEAMSQAVPMRRIGTPNDIAPAVAFLASDGAGFVTGQTLSVSGGLTMA